MDDIYKILSIQDAWRLNKSSTTEHFEATEFWQDDASGVISVENRRIGSDPEERKLWLSQRTRGAQSLVVRFVWLTADVSKTEVDLSKQVKDQILDEFGLQLAYRYFHSFTSGVSALPKIINDDFERQAFAFCFAPKLASIWSHTRFKDQASGKTRPVTEGIIFNAKPSPSSDDPKVPRMSEMLSQLPCNPQVCCSPAFPAFLLSLHLGGQIQKDQTKIVAEMQRVESRTGHHDFHRQENPKPDELNKLSAQVSGHANRLASVSRKTAMIEELLHFIRNTERPGKKGSHQQDPDENISASESDGSSLLECFVKVLQGRLKMQKMETEYILKRVQVQMEAIFHLIAQNDSVHNLELSASTAKIAFDTHRDATSMKTLAIVTMFFLPGSFVSALFSTDCFNWESASKDNIGVPATPQMTLYWAITIPLTVVTFFLYFLWLRIQKYKSEMALEDFMSKNTLNASAAGQLAPPQLQDNGKSSENEIAALGRKRQQFLVNRKSTLSNYHETDINLV